MEGNGVGVFSGMGVSSRSNYLSHTDTGKAGSSKLNAHMLKLN